MSSAHISVYRKTVQKRLIEMLRRHIANTCSKIKSESYKLKLKASKNDYQEELRQIKEKEDEILNMLYDLSSNIGYTTIIEDFEYHPVNSKVDEIVKKALSFINEMNSLLDEKIKKDRIEKEKYKKDIEQALQETEKSMSKPKTKEPAHTEKKPSYTEDDLKLISKVKNIPVKTLKTFSDENIKNLLEEVKLIKNKEKEVKMMSSFYKSSIKSLIGFLDDEKAREKAEELLKKEFIRKEEFEGIRDQIINLLQQKEKEEEDKEVKNEIVNELLLKGYVIEDETGQILYIDTEDKNYKVMMKIGNGKITSKFVKLVGKKGYKPSEYEKVKDMEKMKKWCSDFDKIKEKLKEKDIEINTLKTVYEMEDEVNYVYSEEIKKLKKEKGVKNAMGKRA